MLMLVCAGLPCDSKKVAAPLSQACLDRSYGASSLQLECSPVLGATLGSDPHEQLCAAIQQEDACTAADVCLKGSAQLPWGSSKALVRGPSLSTLVAYIQLSNTVCDGSAC